MLHYCEKVQYLTSATSITPFNGLFSSTTWVSRHQKGKPLDFTVARDDGGSGISWTNYANHLHLAPDR